MTPLNSQWETEGGSGGKDLTKITQSVRHMNSVFSIKQLFHPCSLLKLPPPTLFCFFVSLFPARHIVYLFTVNL